MKENRRVALFELSVSAIRSRYQRGDTIAYFLLNRSLYFFPKNLFKRLEIRNCKLSYDLLGNITEFTGSFDSLEREDSLVIVNDYPDFVKKAMEWKGKK